MNVQCSNGVSALVYALENKSGFDLEATCRVLCAFGPDLNAKSLGKPPKLGPESVFDLCLRRLACVPITFGVVTNTVTPREVKHELINAVDASGRSVLLRTMQAKCYDAARGLLYLGADPSLVPPQVGERAPVENCFIQAIQMGGVDLGQAMLQAVFETGNGDKGNLLNAPSNTGVHPAILAAARLDPLEVRCWMELFIRFKANLQAAVVTNAFANQSKQRNAGTLAGSSLLLELTRRGHVEAAMLVWDYYDSIGHKFDVNEKDTMNRSLIFYACYRYKRNDRSPILLRLLRAGANPETKDLCLTTPLSAACRAGNLRAVLMLINKTLNLGAADDSWMEDPGYSGRCELNTQDEEGNTPLWYAVLSNSTLIVLALLKAGAQADLKCEQGRTPLMLAVRSAPHKDVYMFKALIGIGKANPLIRDEKGNSEFDYAFMMVSESIYIYIERERGLQYSRV